MIPNSDRRICYDAETKALVFTNCVFHPFIPVFTARRSIPLAEVGMPFVARSAYRRGNSFPVGARYVLPTSAGYVYFRVDKPSEIKALLVIRRVLKANGVQGRTQKWVVHQYVGRVAFLLLVLAAVVALWVYYAYFLPRL